MIASKHRAILISVFALSVSLVGCQNESIPLAAETDESGSTEARLGAKPDCSDPDSTHPKCTGDDGGDGGDGGGNNGNELIPFSFPAFLHETTDANAMVDAGGQFLNVPLKRSDKIIGGISDDPYYVSHDFDVTYAAGSGACTEDAKLGFTLEQKAELFALLKDPSQDRGIDVTIVRNSLEGADSGHFINIFWGGGLSLGLLGSPTVSKVHDPDPGLNDDSGTYRFTDGTITLWDFTGQGAKNARQLHCNNLDTLELTLNFNAP